MFTRFVASRTAFLLRRKGSVIVFFAFLAMALMNFIGNVTEFQGRDVVSMVQPMRLLLLSYSRTDYDATNTLLFTQLYPLLVVCPAGFAHAREKNLGADLYFVSRIGRKKYLAGSLAAGFFATAIVCAAPFLIEVALNCLSFPLNAANDMRWSYYDPDYIAGVRNYFMHGLCLVSPYLYAVAGTLFFGFVSGLLGAFTEACSMLARVKYHVTLFLPVFVLLNASLILGGSAGPDEPSVLWYDFLLLFDYNAKRMGAFAAVLFLLILFSVCAAVYGGRKDTL